MKTNLGLWPIIGVLIYFAFVFGVIFFLHWRRRSLWPFKNDGKLLRGPGEDLRRKIAASDENFALELLAGLGGGLLLAAVLGGYGTKLLGLSAVGGLWLGGLGLLVGFGISAWLIGRLWRARQNCFLGWFGERYVAEWLEPAKLQGWRIFHDVPFAAHGAKFNIDHVAVGPGGVFVIETKTRRKGNARPGRKDNEVWFDGHELDWPWGRDTYGLEQAERNAVTLAQTIKDETGERVHVTPLLALPGWWLENKPAKDARLCRAVNPKWLPGILAREQPVLNQKQIDAIAAKLDDRCRDVED